MIDNTRLDSASHRLPDMAEGAKQIAINIGAGLHNHRVPTDDRLRIALAMIVGFADGMTLVVNDGSVPASLLRGVEDLGLVAAALREAADVFEQVHKAGRQ